MRPFALAALAAAALLPACKTETPPPAEPARPPGEVYAVPGGAFIRPHFWFRYVLPKKGVVPEGATEAIDWRVTNQDTAAQRTILSFVTYTPEAWAAARETAKGTVVHEDSARVLVAVFPETNPYPEGSPAAGHYDSLRIPIDTVRARLVMR